jgi:hypothetical protein
MRHMIEMQFRERDPNYQQRKGALEDKWMMLRAVQYAVEATGNDAPCSYFVSEEAEYFLHYTVSSPHYVCWNLIIVRNFNVHRTIGLL